MMRSLSKISVAMLFAFSPSLTFAADTWTDITGKYKVEADFVGVNGRSIVLRLANGTQREVPIDKLSSESRARAKQLYEAARAGGAATVPAATAPAATAAPAAGMPASSSSKPKDAFAPDVPAVPPMPAFPENASLQETVDFVTQQVLEGHPEVLWYALPADLRAEMDSAEVREAMRPGIMMQVEMQKPIYDVAKKVCEVLIKKKQYVINAQMMQDVPADAKQMIETAYDPASGLVYELVNTMFDSEMVVNSSVTAFVDHHGPRIGGHLRDLAQKVPPQMIDQFKSMVVVNQSGAGAGTITVPQQDGTMKSFDMVAYGGRWVPKDFVAVWEEKGGTMAEGMRQQFEESRAQMEASKQQMAFATGMITGMADQILQPMLDANSQQEFDAALLKVAQMAAMFQGQQGGLGGPPPGGAGPGIPGFPQ